MCCGGDSCVIDTERVCDGKGRNRIRENVPTGTYSCSGGGGDCTAYTDKPSCQQAAGCSWGGGKVKSCRAG